MFIEKTIPLVNALTGYSFAVDHLDGRKLWISTPPDMIISPGTQLEVPEEGMPVRKWTSEKGSLIVRFLVDFPTKLSPSQVNSLLESLPDRLPDPVINPKDETVKVNLQPVDEDNVDREEYEDRSRRNAFDSSSDDDDGNGGVACAQQ